MPALFTRMSIRPNSARVRSAMAARSLPEVTSVGTTLARRLRARTSEAVRSALALSTSATTMSAPMRASASAVARPIPRPAPVTMATCSFSSMTVSSLRQVSLEDLGAAETEHPGDRGILVRAAHLRPEPPELANALEVDFGNQQALGLRRGDDTLRRGDHRHPIVR